MSQHSIVDPISALLVLGTKVSLQANNVQNTVHDPPPSFFQLPNKLSEPCSVLRQLENTLRDTPPLNPTLSARPFQRSLLRSRKLHDRFSTSSNRSAETLGLGARRFFCENAGEELAVYVRGQGLRTGKELLGGTETCSERSPDLGPEVYEPIFACSFP
jgi:hypothetical protein